MSSRDRLKTVVRDLTRARRVQILVESAWGGLFWGLVVSCAAVLVIRVTELPYPAPIAVAYLLALALTAALALAWYRRPDNLQVAILADLRLNLSQKLSTAWEFSRVGADDALAECLATQAIKSRLPSRHERIFPLHVNNWGKLTPVAAFLLMLVSIVDLSRLAEPEVAVVDEVVVGEGMRLREYGRRMEERARREELPRSTREAQEIQRLGARMESAALSRGQVLSRLRRLGEDLDEQRRQALKEGAEMDIGAIDVRNVPGTSLLPGTSPGAMLRRLLDGRLGPGDAEALAADPETLRRLGITPEDLREALAGFESGDDQDLRRILETLSRADRARREAEELDRARDEVDRVRENLGETGVTPERDGEFSQARTGVEGGGIDALPDDPFGQELPGDDYGLSSDPGAGQDPRETSREGPRAAESNVQRGGVILKPQGQFREGPVFTSEARVLPRPGQPTVPQVELDARFATQMEEALSKEDYPLHFKEFIRRYFLTLSEGVPAEAAAGEAGRP